MYFFCNRPATYIPHNHHHHHHHHYHHYYQQNNSCNNQYAAYYMQPYQYGAYYEEIVSPIESPVLPKRQKSFSKSKKLPQLSISSISKIDSQSSSQTAETPAPLKTTQSIRVSLDGETLAKIEEIVNEVATSRRQPYLERQQYHVNGSSGKRFRIRRRLPTPERDVLERTYVVKPQPDIIELLIERPKTPVPKIIERTVIERNLPIIHQSIVKVPPRSYYNQSCLPRVPAYTNLAHCRFNIHPIIPPQPIYINPQYYPFANLNKIDLELDAYTNGKIEELVNQLTSSQKRVPIVKKEQSIVHEPGRIFNLVKRLLTPQPDVILKEVVIHPQKDQIDVMIECPEQPPPLQKEFTIVSEKPLPIVNHELVKLPYLSEFLPSYPRICQKNDEIVVEKAEPEVELLNENGFTEENNIPVEETPVEKPKEDQPIFESLLTPHEDYTKMFQQSETEIISTTIEGPNEEEVEEESDLIDAETLNGIEYIPQEDIQITSSPKSNVDEFYYAPDEGFVQIYEESDKDSRLKNQLSSPSKHYLESAFISFVRSPENTGRLSNASRKSSK